MILLSLVCALVLGSPPDFYPYKPYSAKVPRPDQVLGYPIGTRHTTYREQESCLKGIAASAQSRVREVVYGASEERRPLRTFVISSPRNIQNLEQIRKANLDIAEKPDKSKLANAPVIVWINECIHGDETASFESSMALIYNLAASESSSVAKLLDECVVIVNPSYNPDGHERFVVWFNSIATGSSRDFTLEHEPPSSVDGRTNHYRFDLNRDRVSLSQAESRQEVREFLRWRPQIYVDQHGETSSYFFPPTPMSVNENVNRTRYGKWTERLGKATAAAFDKKAWTYFVRDEFDLYYPGYLDSWTTLTGAIGMTHETDGGSNLASMRDDGTVATLASAAEKHFTSAMAVIESAVKNREELMEDYTAFMQAVISGKHAGEFQSVLIRPSRDEWQNHAFLSQLSAHQIQYKIAAESFSAEATPFFGGGKQVEKFDAGTIIVDMAQPQGALAKALLDPRSNFEPEFVKQQTDIVNKMRGTERYPPPGRPNFYDTTAWNIAFGNGLEACWTRQSPSVKTASEAVPASAEGVPEATVGWYWEYRTLDDVRRAAKLLTEGVRIQVVQQEMKIGGGTIPRGSFLVMKFRNDADALAKLNRAKLAFASPIKPLSTSFPDTGNTGPGSDAVRSLAKPNVAIVFGDSDDYLDFSGVWWLFEQLEIPFTPIRSSRLVSEIDRYTCVLFPEGYSRAPEEKLKAWIRGGGTAIALGGADWMIGENGICKFEDVKLENKLPMYLPGAIARGTLDRRYSLAFGYDSDRVAIPVSGSRSFKPIAEGGGVVTISGDSQSQAVLSGWAWPEETEKVLAGTVWVHDQPVGRGHAIIFLRDPTERAMWPVFNKMILNATFLTPAPKN